MAFKVYADDFIVAFRFNTFEHILDQIQNYLVGAYVRLSDAIRKSDVNFAVGKGQVVSSDNTMADAIAAERHRCYCKKEDCKCESNHKITVYSAAGKPIRYIKDNERVKKRNTRLLRSRPL